MDIVNIWHYIQANWFQLTVDIIAGINVIVAGLRVLGFTEIADEFLKVEIAIGAMVQAALNKKGA